MTASVPARRSGAAILFDVLTDLGVELIFGHTGGAVIPLHVELNKRMRRGKPAPRFILCRQEGAAGHAAEGYARAGGRVGVVLATSGPGATNLATPIADAHKDSVPTVFITGQVSSTAIGSDAFQEVDTLGMTRPISKHNYLVKTVADLEWTLREAFALANSGRPGPVVVDICKDAQIALLDQPNPPRVRHRTPYPFDREAADRILEALAAAERPVIKAGGGVIHAEVSDALRQFVERFDTPVTTTFNALGAVPLSARHALGMPGMHGSIPANYALREADFILTLGGRFDDRVAVKGFATGKRIAHVDIDPSEIDKTIKTDLALVASLEQFFEHALASPVQAQHPAWMERISAWRTQMPLPYPDGDYIKPQAVIETLSELTAGDATLVTGVGQHQMWAAQYYGFQRPRQWISSGGLGTMGFGLPAAIGAWFANPNQPVVLVDGDGSFQMNIQELATVVAHRIPLKIFVLNNSFLGMVRQWEDMMDDGHHYETCLARNEDCERDCIAIDQTCRRQVPNLTGLSHVYPGLKTQRLRGPLGMRESLREALEQEGSVLVDVWVDKAEDVLPMVPPGKRLDAMIERT
ncbi:biosynthetic-type acetolactate synthase large subunit [Rhabdochromatium marinum]|uniref:biosynthetic-type acetolactate synthase large subunit n=1 Tax=Rhabdochromatium marinum TaxID=48729 RepID=UPI001904C0F3|nr:biosynthetic-type acetolactate synthase large subunit [Rhabdochromatium marinum]MBK1647259.1 acetolactate synthase, large subunit, biosynthetic type [Rhabdochromatium marinum]